MTNLTEKQIAVLKAFPMMYDGDLEAVKSDLGSTWTDVEELAANSGLSVASVRGVLGHLVNAGLVGTDEGHDGGSIQCLTEEGCDALMALGKASQPKIENGIEMDPEAGEAFEAPLLDFEVPPAEEKPRVRGSTRIKRSPLAEDYIGLQRASEDSGVGKNDCSVIALAILAGVGYEEAHKAMEQAGREPLKGASIPKIKMGMKILGLQIKEINPQDIIAKYPLPHCKALKNVTTHHPRRFPGSFDKDKLYAIVTSSHILAIKDGEVKDFTVNRSLRATHIWEITPQE